MLASIALHVVLGAVLLQVLLIPGRLRWALDEPPPRPERIGFIALPRDGAFDPGKDGGDDRPITSTPPRARAPLVLSLIHI